jgi:lipopolysaccharide transport system ATP-binding protein
MGNVAIRVTKIGKEYRIGSAQQGYRTFRETLTDVFAAPFQRAWNLMRGQAYGAAGLLESIWALKDVSFEVRHGEVVGIIGRNGAGKSTLLKILSRITEPTEGYADVYGRVGSLLEVGTGFHPELTGRENIYLNGAILGMSRKEIDRKFDGIVAFAEVEKFIDTPVKHYSSGMGLRLGFAVAAHLEPEILVVDEVLAVGDSSFQKKCLGRMEQVADTGRTVLFVSHNMAAISTLCRKAVVLDGGQLVFVGSTSEAIRYYQQHLRIEHTVPNTRKTVSFSQVRITPAGELSADEPFDLTYQIHCQRSLPAFRLFCILSDESGDTLVHLFATHHEYPDLTRAGTYNMRLRFPTLWLRPGIYSLHLKMIVDGLGAGTQRFLSDNCLLTFHGSINTHPEAYVGRLTPQIEWEMYESSLVIP